MSAPGGPYLDDRYGRVALMHGVDLVYKVPPYEVEVQGTGPNVLTPQEAQRMAALGFDVVRLGIIWKGLEPGTAQVNDSVDMFPRLTPPIWSRSVRRRRVGRLSEAARCHHRALGPLRDLFAHRHAPGRVQRRLRR